VNKKKIKENANKSATLNEAMKNAEDGKEKVRLSEQHLREVQRKAKGHHGDFGPDSEAHYDFVETPEEIPPEPLTKKAKVTAPAKSSQGTAPAKSSQVTAPAKSSQVTAPAKSSQGTASIKKSKAPEKLIDVEAIDDDELPEAQELAKKSKGKRKKASAQPDVVDSADLLVGDVLWGPDPLATPIPLEVIETENDFEEIETEPMDTENESDPTAVMFVSKTECTLCANIETGDDFGTAGCSHTLHKGCLADVLAKPELDLSRCPECRNPFSRFVPLPVPKRNWTRLMQRK